MTPETENTPAPSQETQQAPETDEEFLARLDGIYAGAQSRLDRHWMEHIVHGKIDEYGRELEFFMQQCTLPDGAYRRLQALAGESYQARLLLGYFHPDKRGASGSGDSGQKDAHGAMQQWAQVRARLSYGDLQGATAIADAMFSILNDVRRKDYYDALNAKNSALAQLAETAKTVKAEIAEFIPEVAGLIAGLEERMAHLLGVLDEEDKKTQPWEAGRLHRKRMAGDISNSVDIKDRLAYIVDRLGLGDLYRHITLCVPQARHAVARCIPVDPPETLVVVYHEPVTRLLHQVAIPFHELGHGLHFAGVATDLPFVFRRVLTPWHEAMAFVFEDLITEPGVLRDGDNGDIGGLRSRRMTERLASLQRVLLYLHINLIRYGSHRDQSPKQIDAAIRELCQKKFPSFANEYPYWWANNMYIVEDRFYSINYLYGWMIAAQIRAWWKRTHTEPLLSQAFGAFLRERCYKPGNSIPWWQLLRDITGEDLNPQYLTEELALAMPFLQSLATVDN